MEHVGFVVFSFDVSCAFAKGMAFDASSALTGTELRAVQFDVPRAGVYVLHHIQDLRGYDPITEVCAMILLIFSYADARRT